MRRFVLVLIALSTVPANAAAQDRACRVTGPEERAERTLREEIRIRGVYGFRDDRAYVQRLIAAGPPSRRHGIRVTKAEDRYLDRRAKLGVGAKVGRYLRKRPAIMDFWDVRDDWPRGPYMAVFVTDDPANHRATIKRLASYPRSTRVVRVRYSAREKDRIQNRMQRDFEALERAGFDVRDMDTDWGVDRIDVEVVTKRKDAARYFARRYGPAVKTHTRATSTVLACVNALRYEIAPDGRSLTVHWSDAPERAERIELTERGDRVSIGVVAAVGGGRGDSGGKAVVRLRAPLGDRPVYDADDGTRLLQSGPSPGAPPCPERAGRRPPLEALADDRARHGMSTDPALLQQLLAAGQEYTPEEQAWLEQVRRVESDRVVHDYLFGGRVFPDWGGTTLVARYPEPPYLIVRFVRRFAFHARELGRMAKVPIRFERSTVRRDWFDLLALYIQDDARAADGFIDDDFYVVQAEANEGEQAVDVYVITRRTDGDTVFKGRYGGIVRVHVIGDRYECRDGYDIPR